MVPPFLLIIGAVSFSILFGLSLNRSENNLGLSSSFPSFPSPYGDEHQGIFKHFVPLFIINARFPPFLQLADKQNILGLHFPEGLGKFNPRPPPF